MRSISSSGEVHLINLGTALVAGGFAALLAAAVHQLLYFIGEVVDITGWLGGYNFQWAWASAFVCAQALDIN